MIRAAITGGIGSGKTTVSRVFSLLGVPVYNCDERARWLSENDPELVRRIKDIFGENAYSGGRQNRPYIASKVFSDSGLLERLNRAVHPALLGDYLRWAEEHTDHPYTLMEAAILIESGFDKFTDFIVVVTAPEELRVWRTVRRDGTDSGSVRMRIQVQMPEEQRLKYADAVIRTDEKELVIPRILHIHERLSQGPDK